MALVGEPSLLRHPGEGLVGTAQKGFRSRYPALHDVAPRPDPDRLLERTAEVIGAEAGDPGDLGQGQATIEMRFDVVTHSPQPLSR